MFFPKFLLISIILLIIPFIASADTVKILGLVECDPTLKPSDPKGCGIDAFIKLLDAAIRFLLINIVLPVAVLMLIYAGFVIMTAGGSEERVRKGKAIITWAVAGIAITVLAAALVAVIYSVFIGGAPPIR